TFVSNIREHSALPSLFLFLFYFSVCRLPSGSTCATLPTLHCVDRPAISTLSSRVCVGSTPATWSVASLLRHQERARRSRTIINQSPAPFRFRRPCPWS